MISAVQLLKGAPGIRIISHYEREYFRSVNFVLLSGHEKEAIHYLLQQLDVGHEIQFIESSGREAYRHVRKPDCDNFEIQTAGHGFSGNVRSVPMKLAADYLHEVADQNFEPTRQAGACRYSVRLPRVSARSLTTPSAPSMPSMPPSPTTVVESMEPDIDALKAAEKSQLAAKRQDVSPTASPNSLLSVKEIKAAEQANSLLEESKLKSSGRFQEILAKLREIINKLDR